MYCIKCGAENADNAKFCNMCGNIMQEANETKTVQNEQHQVVMNEPKVQQPIYSQTYTTTPSQPADYRQLGGWLAVLAYGHLVGAAIMGILIITSLVSLVSVAKLISTYSNYYGAAQTMALIVPALIALGAYGFGIYCCIKASQMIRTKDSGILKFYEFWFTINFGAFLLMTIVGGVQYIGYVFSPIICLVIYEAYFRKSVRVRTYFNYEELLQSSYITKIMASNNINFENFRGTSNTTNQPASNNTHQRNITPEKFCSVCGTGMLMSEMFCPKCGTKKEEIAEPQEVIKPEPIVVKENIVPQAEVLEQPAIATAKATETEEKLFCIHCGAKLLPDADFCIKCGKAK